MRKFIAPSGLILNTLMPCFFSTEAEREPRPQQGIKPDFRIIPARFISGKEDAPRCELCPRRCRLAGESGGGKIAGICRVRVYNTERGLVELPYYGFVSALARDPIEKKPLYHWRPGSSILSAGFFGCNLHCPFCQNWSISQIAENSTPKYNGNESGGYQPRPEELIARAETPDENNKQIAYTYSEPLVHAEYLVGCMEEACRRGIANVLVTNGCVNERAAEEVLSRTGAANIDLKCFSAKTYANVLGGNLEAVLDFIRRAVALGVHTEITTLVVPGLNDSEKELMAIAEFIAGLSANVPNGNTSAASIPWHLSAYHPDWKWSAPPTRAGSLTAAAKKARAVLPHVYTGNIAGDHNNTLCGNCGAVLVRRSGYRVEAGGLCFPDTKEIVSPGAAAQQDAAAQQRNTAARQTAAESKRAFYRCATCGADTAIRWR